MATGNVNINKAQGQGSPINGKDHYSGIVFYLTQASEYPTGIMSIYSTGAKTVGQILEHTDHKVYRVLTTDALTATPANDVTSGFVEEITDLQELAEARTALVTKSNMESFGIVEGGNADKVWYQLNYFFAKNPNGFVWIRIADKALGTTNFNEIDDLVLVSDGDVRKVSIYGNGNNHANFTASQATALQAKYAQYETEKTPLHIALFPLGYAETYDNFIDLKDSGNNYGVAVYNAFDLVKNDAQYPALGVIAGTWAISKISESIGHVRQFDMISAPNGTNSNNEFDKFGFLDSSGLISWSVLKAGNNAVANILDGKGWNFLTKIVGISGSFVNDMSTVSAEGNDFDKVFYVCTLDKASRNTRASLLPEINGEITFNSDGTIQDADLHRFQDLAETPLDLMVADGEISAYEVVIDETQDVASTGILSITIRLVLNGVTKTINVNLERVKAIG